MRLIENWRHVMATSYSSWFGLLGIVAWLVPWVCLHLMGTHLDPEAWYYIGGAFLFIGWAGRFIDQGTSKNRAAVPWVLVLAGLLLIASLVWKDAKLPAAEPEEQVQLIQPSEGSQFLKVAFPLVAEFEGLRLEAYRDIVGVWTVCYGHTRGVAPGDKYTEAQCADLLGRELLEYRAGLHRYFTHDTKAKRLPVTRDAAFTSLAFNVGIAGAGKSTAVKRLNAGDIPGSCDALLWWNKAGGRVVRGLVNRRAKEHVLCMKAETA